METHGLAETRLRKDAELNRQRIVVAARDVFRDRGLGATLNDVARHGLPALRRPGCRQRPTASSSMRERFTPLVGQLVARAKAQGHLRATSCRRTCRSSS
jgi:hypothetical protein